MKPNVYFLPLALAAVVGVSNAASQIGGSCYSNADCTSRNAQCYISSPSCNSGTCRCVPGVSATLKKNKQPP